MVAFGAQEFVVFLAGGCEEGDVKAVYKVYNLVYGVSVAEDGKGEGGGDIDFGDVGSYEFDVFQYALGV